MCTPCIGDNCCGFGGCCSFPRPELAIKWDEYRWFDNCTDPDCFKCHATKEELLDCRRNRHIVEALSCLFNQRLPYMLNILFKLASWQPGARVPRDREWDVMENVKAPYTELDDLLIYDSMYDRCGLPINPLHRDNIYKIVRMMFLSSVLTIGQQKYLLRMLQRLNEHSNCPVNISRLMEALSRVDVKTLVCSLRQQEKLCRAFYMSKQCADMCDLYARVTLIDKNAVKRRRRRLRRHKKPTKPGDEPVRVSVLNRQFCERRLPRPDHDTKPRSTDDNASGSQVRRQSQSSTSKGSPRNSK